MSSTISATRRTRTAAVAALLAAGAAGMASAPAEAVVLDTDHPRVTATHHDFGTNWVLGAPVNGGDLEWDLVNGVTTPRISGYHYLTDQACGRVRVEYYDAGHSLLGSRNSAVRCAPGNGKTQWWTSFTSFSHTNVTHVHVMVQRRNASGSFTTMGTDVEDFN